jgi:hypothetical protein
MLMAAITLPAAGCKKPDKNAKRTDGRTVKASIAEFNPDDVSIDLDKWGTARVDDWLVQEAFNRSFEGIDRCIVELKQRKRMSEDKTLGGNVEFAVKLNPSKERPFAVNATLSNGKLSKDEKFKGCLREAVAEAGYPTYDGPPQVAEFYVEPLDPGFEYE